MLKIGGTSPGVGIINVTNTGTVGMDRLVLVKNQDGKILKEYSYEYQANSSQPALSKKDVGKYTNMKINVKVISAAVLYVLIASFIIVVYQGDGIFYLIREYSTISYQDDLSNANWFEVKSWVLIYGIVSFFVTRSILGRVSKPMWSVLSISCIYDIVVYFLCIFLMVLYNNFRFKSSGIALITSVDNIFMLALFQIAKRFFLRLYLKKEMRQIG